MNIDATHLESLVAIAQAAGREILEVYAQDFTAWSKEDDSPLTEADLRADRVIRAGLERAFPGVYILSEESKSEGAAMVDRFFLVDPLDGTKEFLKRNDEFTVNIALVEGGEVIAAVVLAPALDELYFAARGLGAWKSEAGAKRPLRVVPPANPLRVIGSRSHGGEALSAWLAQLPGEHAFVAAGSSLKFCRIADARADVYPRFGPTSQWDTAAAQGVLEIAGGAVTDLAGRRLRYGLDRPMLNPEFLAVGAPSSLPGLLAGSRSAGDAGLPRPSAGLGG